MKIDLRRQIDLTPVPTWRPLLPLYEAISNALQAIDEAHTATGEVIVHIHRERDLLDGESEPIVGFRIVDTGIGLTDDNFESFSTSYSAKKEKIGGKGLGRFAYLKVFEQAKIESRYAVDDGPRERSFTFDASFDPTRMVATVGNGSTSGTTVTLAGLRRPYMEKMPKDATKVAHAIIDHFIQMFVGDDPPTIILFDGKVKYDLKNLARSSFGSSISCYTATVRDHSFTIRGVRAKRSGQSRSKVIFAANKRAVRLEGLDKFVPNVDGLNGLPAEDRFSYFAIVTSDYLDSMVDNTRSAFAIDADTEGDELNDEPDMFAAPVPFQEIRNAVRAFVEQDLRSEFSIIDDRKRARVERYVSDHAPYYRPLIRQIDDVIGSIKPTASNADVDSALHAYAYKREKEARVAVSKIVQVGDELPANYLEQINATVKELNDLGQSSLAHYVAHRRVIIDMFASALQRSNSSEKYPLERVVHDIVFKQRGTSETLSEYEQNLWLVDERLNYSSYVESDIPLTSSDVVQSESLMRPDVLIYDRPLFYRQGSDEPSSLTIIEFKRPMRDDNTDETNPLDQILKVAQRVRRGEIKDERGRPIIRSGQSCPIYAYIVCDITDTLRDVLELRDVHAFADGRGYYGHQPKLGVAIEILDYDQLPRDARRRNAIFFNRLGLDVGDMR